jgi:hypothetical protein
VKGYNWDMYTYILDYFVAKKRQHSLSSNRSHSPFQSLFS